MLIMAYNVGLENLKRIVGDLEKQSDVLKKRMTTEKKRRADLERLVRDERERIKCEYQINEDIKIDNSKKNADLENLKTQLNALEITWKQKKKDVEDVEENIRKRKKDMEKEKLSYEKELEEWLEKLKKLKETHSSEYVNSQLEQLNIELESCKKIAESLETNLNDVQKQIKMAEEESKFGTDVYGLSLRERQYVLYILEEYNSKQRQKLVEQQKEIEGHSHDENEPDAVKNSTRHLASY